MKLLHYVLCLPPTVEDTTDTKKILSALYHVRLGEISLYSLNSLIFCDVRSYYQGTSIWKWFFFASKIWSKNLQIFVEMFINCFLSDLIIKEHLSESDFFFLPNFWSKNLQTFVEIIIKSLSEIKDYKNNRSRIGYRSGRCSRVHWIRDFSIIIQIFIHSCYCNHTGIQSRRFADLSSVRCWWNMKNKS